MFHQLLWDRLAAFAVLMSVDSPIWSATRSSRSCEATCERHTLPCLQDVQAAAADACLEVARHERGFWDMASNPAEET